MSSSRRRARKPDRKRRSLRLGRVSDDLAVVRADHLADDEQAEPQSIRLRGRVRVSTAKWIADRREQLGGSRRGPVGRPDGDRRAPSPPPPRRWAAPPPPRGAV